MVIDSRRSTPSSKEYGPYSAEILRIPCGPKRVPERYVVPPSKGAPKTATSYSPQRRTSSTYGALRKVLMPAKCGSSPRLKVGMRRSTMESAPCRPSSRPRATSSSHLVVGDPLPLNRVPGLRPVVVVQRHLTAILMVPGHIDPFHSLPRSGRHPPLWTGCSPRQARASGESDLDDLLQQQTLHLFPEVEELAVAANRRIAFGAEWKRELTFDAAWMRRQHVNPLREE